MDCVYICRAGENEELRYSIRSVVAHLPHSKIWLVGNKPSWYTGNFIQVDDIGGKFTNITNALSKIASSQEISEDFILMNDDFFVIRPIDEMPVMHGGSLHKKIEEYLELDPNSRYAEILRLAYKYLKKRSIKDPLDYDIHVPMVMNKNNLKFIVNKTNAPRSVYGNIFDVGGEQVRDVKVYNKFNKLSDRSYDFVSNDFPFVSCEDKSFTYLYKTILKKMFPNKTIYEK